jgi:prophage regulatory protein
LKLERNVSRKFIKTSAVAKMVGVGSKKIRYMAKAGDFPKPVAIGKSDSWIESEVVDWIEQRIADRDAAVAGGAE